MKCILHVQSGRDAMQRSVDLPHGLDNLKKIKDFLQSQDLRLQTMDFSYKVSMSDVSGAQKLLNDAEAKTYFSKVQKLKDGATITFFIVIDSSKQPKDLSSAISAQLCEDDDLVNLHVYPPQSGNSTASSSYQSKMFIIPRRGVIEGLCRAVSDSVRTPPLQRGAKLTILVMEKKLQTKPLLDEENAKKLLHSHARRGVPLQITYTVSLAPSSPPSTPPLAPSPKRAAASVSPPSDRKPDSTPKKQTNTCEPLASEEVRSSAPRSEKHSKGSGLIHAERTPSPSSSAPKEKPASSTSANLSKQVPHDSPPPAAAPRSNATSPDMEPPPAPLPRTLPVRVREMNNSAEESLAFSYVKGDEALLTKFTKDCLAVCTTPHRDEELIEVMAIAGKEMALLHNNGILREWIALAHESEQPLRVCIKRIPRPAATSTPTPTTTAVSARAAAVSGTFSASPTTTKGALTAEPKVGASSTSPTAANAGASPSAVAAAPKAAAPTPATATAPTPAAAPKAAAPTPAAAPKAAAAPPATAAAPTPAAAPKVTANPAASSATTATPPVVPAAKPKATPAATSHNGSPPITEQETSTAHAASTPKSCSGGGTLSVENATIPSTSALPPTAATEPVPPAPIPLLSATEHFEKMPPSHKKHNSSETSSVNEKTAARRSSRSTSPTPLPVLSAESQNGFTPQLTQLTAVEVQEGWAAAQPPPSLPQESLKPRKQSTSGNVDNNNSINPLPPYKPVQFHQSRSKTPVSAPKGGIQKAKRVESEPATPPAVQQTVAGMSGSFLPTLLSLDVENNVPLQCWVSCEFTESTLFCTLRRGCLATDLMKFVLDALALHQHTMEGTEFTLLLRRGLDDGASEETPLATEEAIAASVDALQTGTAMVMVRIAERSSVILSAAVPPSSSISIVEIVAKSLMLYFLQAVDCSAVVSWMTKELQPLAGATPYLTFLNKAQKMSAASAVPRSVKEMTQWLNGLLTDFTESETDLLVAVLLRHLLRSPVYHLNDFFSSIFEALSSHTESSIDGTVVWEGQKQLDSFVEKMNSSFPAVALLDGSCGRTTEGFVAHCQLLYSHDAAAFLNYVTASAVDGALALQNHKIYSGFELHTLHKVLEADLHDCFSDMNVAQLESFIDSYSDTSPDHPIAVLFSVVGAIMAPHAVEEYHVWWVDHWKGRMGQVLFTKLCTLIDSDTLPLPTLLSCCWTVLHPQLISAMEVAEATDVPRRLWRWALLTTQKICLNRSLSYPPIPLSYCIEATLRPISHCAVRTASPMARTISGKETEASEPFRAPMPPSPQSQVSRRKKVQYKQTYDFEKSRHHHAAMQPSSSPAM